MATSPARDWRASTHKRHGLRRLALCYTGGMEQLAFVAYEDSIDMANIVVDGSPNAGTVLTLTHWPQIAQPAGLGDDLSAQMAFRYLDQPPKHDPAVAVTNNHFDQDGLVGIHALLDPERSIERRAELIDVAAAGDFATYRYRSAARASMAIWSYAEPDRSPLGSRLEVPYPEASALLYETVLPLLIPMLEDPEHFRDLWHEEDLALTAAEQALADGSVQIDEVPDVDLAIVRINEELGLEGGHRFASDQATMMHPMAIHNATTCCRLLLMRGQDYLYADRYETWVQYRSRSLPPRVELEPLATSLEALETGVTSWQATPASRLTPTLAPSGLSSLPATVVEDAVIDHLRRAPASWDPFASNP